ncbi:hypothetical protein Tco_0803197 [Tanacetum coccineum]|uniref:Uncharacterized protein n=1 Tax=Tanacetum coccineum TaxID=301880 RepID=A0ABQ5A0W1_9ASTR
MFQNGITRRSLYLLIVIPLRDLMEWINGLLHPFKSPYLQSKEECMEDHHIRESEMPLKMMVIEEGSASVVITPSTSARGGKTSARGGSIFARGGQTSARGGSTAAIGGQTSSRGG